MLTINKLISDLLPWKDLHDLYGEETVEILKKSDQLNQHFKKMQSHSKLNELYLGTDELLIVQSLYQYIILCNYTLCQ